MLCFNHIEVLNLETHGPVLRLTGLKDHQMPISVYHKQSYQPSRPTNCLRTFSNVLALSGIYNNDIW